MEAGSESLTEVGVMFGVQLMSDQCGVFGVGGPLGRFGLRAC